MRQKTLALILVLLFTGNELMAQQATSAEPLPLMWVSHGQWALRQKHYDTKKAPIIGKTYIPVIYTVNGFANLINAAVSLKASGLQVHIGSLTSKPTDGSLLLIYVPTYSSPGEIAYHEFSTYYVWDIASASFKTISQDNFTTLTNNYLNSDLKKALDAVEYENGKLDMGDTKSVFYDSAKLKSLLHEITSVQSGIIQGIQAEFISYAETNNETPKTQPYSHRLVFQFTFFKKDSAGNLVNYEIDPTGRPAPFASALKSPNGGMAAFKFRIFSGLSIDKNGNTSFGGGGVDTGLPCPVNCPN